MTEYEITIKPGRVNFSPANEAEEILQNVITICTTPKYSVPMDREFGIDGEVIDMPINSVKSRYTQEVVKAVRTFEPRALITRVEFSAGTDGQVYPRLFVKINT